MWLFQKIRGPILVVPRIRTRIYLGLFWGPNIVLRAIYLLGHALSRPLESKGLLLSCPPPAALQSVQETDRAAGLCSQSGALKVRTAYIKQVSWMEVKKRSNNWHAHACMCLEIQSSTYTYYRYLHI